jgi:hypothetical protein
MKSKRGAPPTSTVVRWHCFKFVKGRGVCSSWARVPLAVFPDALPDYASATHVTSFLIRSQRAVTVDAVGPLAGNLKVA